MVRGRQRQRNADVRSGYRRWLRRSGTGRTQPQPGRRVHAGDAVDGAAGAACRSPAVSPPVGRRVDAGLHVDPARVVARLFLPGEQLPGEQVPVEQVPVEQSRTSKIVARIMLLPEPEVEALAAGLVSDFGTRHRHYEDLLIHHASIVCAHAGEQPTLSRSRRLVLGASFTAEYAVEGAALCNPSAVLHPDQGELAEGQVR